jgi:hypothetical protein
MSTSSSSPTWEEQPRRLHIEFPLPADRGWKPAAWALLVVTSLLALPFPLFMVLSVIEGANLMTPVTLFAIAFEALILWFWRKFLRAILNPPPRSHACTLTVEDSTLKVERAGADGDLDVSWDLVEIADIRLCKSAGQNLGGLIHAPLLVLFLMQRDHLVRISVMLPSGLVEDTIIRAGSADAWTDDVESRLRDYLGLGIRSAQL